MRAVVMLLVIAGSLYLGSAPAAAQVPPNPVATQLAGLRKELQRQRKAQEGLRAELAAARKNVEALNQKISDQDNELSALSRELANTKGGGAVGLVLLLVVFLAIAMRRPPGSGKPDELQKRLAALDRRLSDLKRP